MFVLVAMVSLELLSCLEVLLDVIVQAVFPIGIGDFYNTICKTKTKWTHLAQNSVPRLGAKIECWGVY